MPTYRVIVEQGPTLYEGEDLVAALDVYGEYRQSLLQGDENVKVVQLGWNEMHDRVIAEFVGRRQVSGSPPWKRG